MINKHQTTNNSPTKQTTPINQKLTITTTQLSQLSLEELNKVTGGGVGGEGTGGC